MDVRERFFARPVKITSSRQRSMATGYDGKFVFSGRSWIAMDLESPLRLANDITDVEGECAVPTIGEILA
jgi:hypothetical protein